MSHEIVTGRTSDEQMSYFQTGDLMRELGEDPFEGRPVVNCYLCKRKHGDQAVSFVQGPSGLEIKHTELKMTCLRIHTQEGSEKDFILCRECRELIAAVGQMAVEDFLYVARTNCEENGVSGESPES